MAFTLIDSCKGEGSSTGATTSAIDTTGANLIVLAVGGFAAAFTITDSKSNTYTALTSKTNSGNGKAVLYYCLNPTVGSGHTFTVSGTGVYAGLTAAAFSGAASSAVFDVENGATGASATTGQPGSITPSVNGELIIFAGPAGSNGTLLSSVSVGTVAQTTTATTGLDYSIGIAYYEQATAAAINPTLTWNSSTVWSAVIASFKPSAGGGAVTGTLSATESGSDTAAFAGDVYITGTLAASEAGADTSLIAGDVLITGTLAATESGADVADIQGTSAVIATGYLAAIESGSDAAAFAGDVYVSGTLTAIESGADTASLAGDVYITGTLASIETGSDTAAIYGTAAGAITGTLDAIESGSDTASFSGPISVVAQPVPSGGSFTGPSPDVLRFQQNMRDEQELLIILNAAVKAMEYERYTAWRMAA